MKPTRAIYPFPLIAALLLAALTACSGATEPTTVETDTPTPQAHSVTKIYTPNPTLTETPLPSVTQLPTDTPIPIQVCTPTIPKIATVTDDVSKTLGSNTIALTMESGSGIYLLDIDTGILKLVPDKEDDQHMRIISWSSSGCELIVSTKSQDGVFHRVVRIDLDGSVLQELVSRDDISSLGGIRNITISPDENWIAYRISSGKPLGGYDVVFEEENIEVIGVSGQSGPYRVTTGNGGREVAWSSKNLFVAYGDYDENDIYQLYVSKFDGSERHQLTYFTEESAEIRNIRWSPDGNKITFIYERLGNINRVKPRKDDLVVIDLTEARYPITIFDQLYLIYSVWWNYNDIIVAKGSLESEDYTRGIDTKMFWVEANSGEVLENISTTDSPDGFMELIKPYDMAGQIGFFALGKFYVYEAHQASYEWKNKVHIIGIDDWIAPPKEFKGEEFCNQP
jgi:dipeptidyl aminopeptidase/acylaminoacyl peptidase